MTTREYAQTLELLELHGIEHNVVGPPHGGAGVLGKARALARTAPALRRFAKSRGVRPGAGARLARADARGAKPRHPERDRARLRVRDAPAPARAAGGDDASSSRMRSRRAPRPLRCPTAEAGPLPGDQGGVLPRGLRARSCRDRRHRPGRKCSRSCARRRTCRSTTGTATRSSPSVLERLGRDESVHAVVLPRTTEQRAAIEASASPSLHIPERAVDTQSLVALADLTVSAGGTMNREAAALGMPVYTTFTGRLGAVDEMLIAEGRLRPLEAAAGSRCESGRPATQLAFAAIRAPCSMFCFRHRGHKTRGNRRTRRRGGFLHA